MSCFGVKGTVHDIKVENNICIIYAEDIEQAIMEYLVDRKVLTKKQASDLAMRFNDGNLMVTTKCLKIEAYLPGTNYVKLPDSVKRVLKLRKTALPRTIAHYQRMIAWAKEKEKEGRTVPNSDTMEEELGESWEGDYCPLCDAYFEYNADGVYVSESGCKACPLFLAHGHCRINEWYQLCRATTWTAWIEHATTLLNKFIALNKQTGEGDGYIK